MADILSLQNALVGRYLVEREIGAGGMATVYLAQDLRNSRPVALKVLNPELGAVLGTERFLSEIRVTANLQHPHLLPLFDSGEANGLLFYVMPYIEGESLRARLDREKQLPVDEAVRIAASIAGALDYAHRNGVVHRDLKPENILMHEGQPLVADFGIALAVKNAGGNRITQTGLSLGTPQYMSPEQATGDRTVDARSDVYSLGAIAYEMLTGDPPHVGSTSQAIIARLLTEKPRSVRTNRPSVPEYVQGAVERALEKLPADRWATAKEFAEALTGERMSHLGTSAQSPTAPLVHVATSKRMRMAFVALSCVCVALLAVLGWREMSPRTSSLTGRFTIELPDSTTIDGGAGWKLAMSHDGTQLAIVVSEAAGERRTIYLRHMDELVAQRIRGTDSARSPIFSPDGRFIAFEVNGSIRVVPVTGGTPKLVVDSGVAASWGDDGRIVYMGHNAIWSVSADGGPRRLIIRADSSNRLSYVGFPWVLPGSKAILVAWRGLVGGGDSIRIGVVTLKDGKLKDLGAYGSNPRYSRNGYVVFGQRNAELQALPFSLRSLETTGAQIRIAESVWVGAGGAVDAAFADNGSLAFQEAHGAASTTSQLVSVDMRGGTTELSREPDYFKEPRISPDGKRIAVRRAPTVDRGDLWIFDIASQAMTRLTSDTGSIRGEWTPDGTRVVFLERANDSVSVKWRYWDRSGPDSVLLKTSWLGGGVNEISLANDGSVAMRMGASTENADIWSAKLSSMKDRKPVVTAQTTTVEAVPRLSPNGKLLAYRSMESGRNEVLVTPMPGPGPRIAVSVGGGNEPMWSPDSKQLYYRTATHMMVAYINPQPLSVTRRDTLFLDRYARYNWHQAYDVMPDGKHLLMVAPLSVGYIAQNEIRFLANWRGLREGTGLKGDER